MRDFIKPLVALTFMRRILQLQFLTTVVWKLGLPRPKLLHEYLSHSTAYHQQKIKKSLSCDAKDIKGPEPPEGSNGRNLFEVLSNGILFMILSDKFSLGSSGKVLSLGCLVIKSSFGSSVIGLS